MRVHSAPEATKGWLEPILARIKEELLMARDTDVWIDLGEDGILTHIIKVYLGGSTGTGPTTCGGAQHRYHRRR